MADTLREAVEPIRDFAAKLDTPLDEQLEDLADDLEGALATLIERCSASVPDLGTEQNEVREAVERISKLCDEWEQGTDVQIDFAARLRPLLPLEATPTERCPTCGSDHPAWYLESGPNGPVCRWNRVLGCPDPFHTPAEAPGGEQREWIYDPLRITVSAIIATARAGDDAMTIVAALRDALAAKPDPDTPPQEPTDAE